MKTITYADVKAFDPCYDPIKYIPETWSGTILDVLKMDNVPVDDRLWVATNKGFLPEKLLRLWAVWCARQVQHLMKDSRSLAALDVAEKYAKGDASVEEVESAEAAAWGAAEAAAGDAAGDARVAAGVAAGDAAGGKQINQLILIIEEEREK